jgi:hypothetical protein
VLPKPDNLISYDNCASAAVLASPKGKAMIKDGQPFSIEELQAAFAQVLAEADCSERVVVEAAMNALMARKAN